jgi:hypothetical protein
MSILRCLLVRRKSEFRAPLCMDAFEKEEVQRGFETDAGERDACY